MVKRSERGIRLALLALLALAVAACTPTAPPSPSTANAGSAQTRKVAFEPITGLPDDRATVFATELGRYAVEKDLNIVPRDSEEVDFRAKGYVTAKSAGNETVVSHVWDVFDRDGARVHRIEGEVRLPAALPDPWQAVTDDALQEVARSTVDELSTWLGSGAPVTTAEAGKAGGAPATVGSMGLLPAGQIAAATTQQISAPPSVVQPRATASAFRTEGGRPSVYLGQILGMDPDQAGTLAAAMQAELARAGMAPAPTPGEADLVVSAESTVGPELQNGRTMAIIWSIDRTSGGSLGTIRQVRGLPVGALPGSWPTEARHAAMSAAHGLVGLLQQGQ